MLCYSFVVFLVACFVFFSFNSCILLVFLVIDCFSTKNTNNRKKLTIRFFKSSPFFKAFFLFFLFFSFSILQQSVCAEMADELRFAVRCHGSQKPRFKRHCSKCKSTRAHNPTAHSETHVESPNGVIQLREVRKSPRATGTTRDFEYDYKPDYKQEFSGDYLHVDYSDPES